MILIRIKRTKKFRRRKKRKFLYVLQVAAINYTVLISGYYLITPTNASFTDSESVSATVQAGYWDIWDKSSLEFIEYGEEFILENDQIEIYGIIQNGNDSGNMEGPVDYQIYFTETGNPKDGEVIYSGEIPSLDQGEVYRVVFKPSVPGKYMFKAYQRPGHPGKGELWSEEIIVEENEIEDSPENLEEANLLEEPLRNNEEEEIEEDLLNGQGPNDSQIGEDPIEGSDVEQEIDDNEDVVQEQIEGDEADLTPETDSSNSNEDDVQEPSIEAPSGNNNEATEGEQSPPIDEETQEAPSEDPIDEDQEDSSAEQGPDKEPTDSQENGSQPETDSTNNNEEVVEEPPIEEVPSDDNDEVRKADQSPPAFEEEIEAPSEDPTDEDQEDSSAEEDSVEERPDSEEEESQSKSDSINNNEEVVGGPPIETTPDDNKGNPQDEQTTPSLDEGQEALSEKNEDLKKTGTPSSLEGGNQEFPSDNSKNDSIKSDSERNNNEVIALKQDEVKNKDMIKNLISILISENSFKKEGDNDEDKKVD